MQKVLYLTPGCFDKGGISRYNRYQIRCIRELFGETNVIVFSLMAPDHNTIEEHFKVQWHGSQNGFRSKIGFVFQIIKALIQFKPTLIMNAHVNFSGLVVFMSFVFRVKNVLNIYGSEVWSGLSLISKIGLEKSDFVISDCHNTANYVNGVYRNKEYTYVIWDCVDLHKFKYNEIGFTSLKTKYNLPHREGQLLILTLGRMSRETEYKGYNRLLDVFSKVLKRGVRAKLIMAGSGDLVETLKQKAEQLGINGEVSFTGSVDENDMASLYSYAHIFSLVTETGKDKGEGIPLTPLEAMACRCPIIVGDQDGSQEAVFEEQNGFIIDPQDLELHANIICNLAQSPNRLQEMATNAERIAKQYFGYDLFKEKHEVFFSKIVNQR